MQENQQPHPVDIFVRVDLGQDHHHFVALDQTGKRMCNKALPNDETKLRAFITNFKTHSRLLFVVDRPATIGALPVAVARGVDIMVAYLRGQTCAASPTSMQPKPRPTPALRPLLLIDELTMLCELR